MSHARNHNQINRRKLLQLSAAATVAGLLLPGRAAAAGPALVQNGVARAVLVRPDAAEPWVTTGASEIVAYVRIASGATIDSVTVTCLDKSGAKYDGFVRIYVGFVAADAAPGLAATVAALRPDGFAIVPYGNTLSILGQSQYGTLAGCYEFLREIVGVRWMVPGPNGDDVPPNTTLLAPDTSRVVDPPFLSRYAYLSSLTSFPLWGTHAYNWTRRNGSYPANTNYMGFGHNLAKIFPPSIYNNQTGHPESYHPEFYPPFHVPTSDSDKVGWQPSFTDPNTVHIAADYAITAFDGGARSVSLSVNDNGGFCEQVATHPAYPNALNSFGLLDLSDVYFAWVNDVASEVMTRRPEFTDRRFAVLAYNQVGDPPAFALHPQVVPAITRDRHTWIDAGVRTADQARHNAWLGKADQVGWYDYQYGVPYLVPRVYFHHAATVAQFGASQPGNPGIPFFGEMVHNIGEGPKIPLTLRLMTDPTTNVDTFLSEWCTRAVGSAAAPALAAYFAHWEEFWTNRIKSTHWFRSTKDANYLNFFDAGYLSAVTDSDITQSRAWLTSAESDAVTAPQKARAKLLLDNFKFYEESALSYPRYVAPATTATAAGQQLDMVETTLQRSIAAAASRETTYQTLLQDVQMAFANPFGGQLLRWSGWNFFPMWNVAGYLKASEPAGGPIRQRVTTLTGNANSNIAAYAQMILDVADNHLTVLGTNPSFESGATTPTGWAGTTAGTAPFGSALRTTERARTGTASLLVNGAIKNLVLSQTINPVAGFLRCAVHYYVPAGTAPRGRIFIRPVLKDSSGNTVYFRYDAAPLDAGPGTWQKVEWMDLVPAGMTIGSVYITVDALDPTSKVYLDDVELLQIS